MNADETIDEIRLALRRFFEADFTASQALFNIDALLAMHAKSKP